MAINGFEPSSPVSETGVLVLYTIPLCARWESNPHFNLGRITCYHYTTGANPFRFFLIGWRTETKNSAIVLAGFEPTSQGSRPQMLDHYTIGLMRLTGIAPIFIGWKPSVLLLITTTALGNLGINSQIRSFSVM